MTQFIGKYRGRVVQNVDTQNRGRILVSCPHVFGNGNGWALPCAPYAGQGVAIYAVPPVDANVWLEFEGGNADHPIWTGCFWDENELPQTPQTPPLPIAHIFLQTVDANFIHISDGAGALGGITLQTKGGAKITMNDTGITIDNGKGAKISLTSSTVDINNGALSIT